MSTSNEADVFVNNESGENVGSGRTRKSSGPNRFEVEKVSEGDLANSSSNLNKLQQQQQQPQTIAMIDDNDDDPKRELLKKSIHSVLNTEETPAAAASGSNAHHSALKKPTKAFKYNDDYFVFDSVQNTATKNNNTFLKSYSDKLKKERDTLLERHNNQNAVDAESINSKNAGCFQVEYDDKNNAKSITCNLEACGIASYTNCCHDFKTISFYQKLIAEFLGTMLLTLYACSIGLKFSETQEPIPAINGCLGGGLTLATLIWVLGNVSGGHFNPSVTIAFFVAGKLNPLLTMLYVAAQVGGGITGAFILSEFRPETARGSLSVTLVHADISLAQAYFIELIITFILVLTVFSCCDARRNDLTGSFPLQIGLAVAVGGLFGGKFTGGSMNPARSIGPAVVMGIWEHHWIYWAGPISGGIVAAFTYQILLTLKCERKPILRSVSSSA